MKEAIKRSILRWVHIVFGLTILGYIYGPPEEVLQYRDNFRFIFVPIIFLSGLLMWKGHVITRLFSKGSGYEKQ